MEKAQANKFLKKPIHEYLLSEMDRLGLTPATLAEKIDVSPTLIYGILQGNIKISRKRADSLATVFGESSDFWLRSQVYVVESGEDQKVLQVLVSSSDIPEGEYVLPKAAPTLLVDHMIRGAVASGVLGITPFAERNLSPASMDLTIGEDISHIGSGMIDLASCDFRLEPMQTVYLESAETVEFPKNFLARVGGRAENVKSGLIVHTGAQVDPGYSGKIGVMVQNIGPKPVTLFKGQRIITLELYHLSIAPDRKYNLEDDSDGFGATQILNGIETEIQKLFTLENISDNEFSISWEEGGIEFSGSDKDELKAAAHLYFIDQILAPEVPDKYSATLVNICSRIKVSKPDYEYLRKKLLTTAPDSNDLTQSVLDSAGFPNVQPTLNMAASLLKISVIELVLLLLGTRSS